MRKFIRLIQIVVVLVFTVSSVQAGWFDGLVGELAETAKKELSNSAKETITGTAKQTIGKVPSNTSGSANSSQCSNLKTDWKLGAYETITTPLVNKVYEVCRGGDQPVTVFHDYRFIDSIYKNKLDGVAYLGKVTTKLFSKYYTSEELKQADMQVHKIGEQVVWGYTAKDYNIQSLSKERLIDIITGKNDKDENGREIIIIAAHKVYNDLLLPLANEAGAQISPKNVMTRSNYDFIVASKELHNTQNVKKRLKNKNKVFIAVGLSYEYRFRKIEGDYTAVEIANQSITIPVSIITKGNPTPTINAIIEFAQSNLDWRHPLK